MRRLLLFGTLMLGCLLAVAPVAGAAVIPGSPLRVYADEQGRTQARFEGLPDGEFDPANQDAANAGIQLIVYTGQGASVQGLLGSAVVSGPTLSGTGTAADPYRLTTVYDSAGHADLAVTRVLEYVDGDTSFADSYTIRNEGAGATRFRLLEYGNLAHASTSLGQGFFDVGPPAYVGGENIEVGSAGGLVELGTPWSRFQESDQSYGPMLRAVFGPGLENTVDPSLNDDFVVVQFDTYMSSGLPPGEEDTFDAVWFFERFDGLTLDGPDAMPVGTTATVNARSLNHGEPVAGKPIRYTVAGANPTSGTAATSSAGTASFSWHGAVPGTDSLTAFVDGNGNGVADDGGTEASLQVVWQAAPPVVDATAPVGSAAFRRVYGLLRTLRRGLAGTVESNEAGIARATATVSRRVARRLGLTAARRVTVARGSATVAAPGRANLRLRFTRRAKRKLRSARRVRLTIRTSITDTAGNVTRVRKRATLVRR